MLELGTHTLHYEYSVRGQRPVVALSNSLGTDLHLWDAQMEALLEHFNVLRYDTRGHGRSSTPSGPWSIADLGGDVVALLDSLQLARVHVCGLSLGGVVAQWLGIHVPARIDRLVLCNTAARIGSVAGWTARMATVSEAGMAAIVPSVLTNWFTPAFRASQSELVEEAGVMLAATAAPGYIECCGALRDCDLRDEVNTIPAETLVVYGDQDPVTTAADADSLAASIPGACLLKLQAAHLSNLEATAEFNRGVCNFLKGGGAAHG